MANLCDILYKAGLEEISGNIDCEVKRIHFDSRLVGNGDLFVAMKGTQVDGHRFIDQALQKGAIAIVCEEMPAKPKDGIAWCKVKDSSLALGILADNFFESPSSKLKLICITGTNGKTTVATLLHRLFAELGLKTGLISTVDCRIGERVLPSTHTTPDPVKINELLFDMVEEQCGFCFMEVSSHAIDQNRIEGLQFDGAIYTNISHDHLDYHKTFREYINVKKRLFDELTSQAWALINIDDRNGRVMVQNTKAKVHTYSLTTLADFKGKIIENNFEGLQIQLNHHEIFSHLVGEFNGYNLLAVYGTAVLLGQNEEASLVAISTLRAAEGRFDFVISPQDKLIGIVDYAHTPDALEKVLLSINDARSGAEQVITIVGCGGNRDKDKRPLMARIAAQYSDLVILTSDNPRNEDPQEIIRNMEEGIELPLQKKVLSISNRKEAIKTACSMANANDIILVAGKGHEKYQEIKGVKTSFDDKEVLTEIFKILDR